MKSQTRATATWKEIKPFAIRDIAGMLDDAKSDNQTDGYFIILYDESGQVKREYSFSTDGLAAAIDAATSGDVIWIPAGTLTSEGSGLQLGDEIENGSIPADPRLTEVSGLTIGNWYAIENGGGPWSAPGGSNQYNWHIANEEDGFQYTSPPTYQAWANVPWAHHIENLSPYSRVYFQATTTSIFVGVNGVLADLDWSDYTGSLTYSLKAVTDSSSWTIPEGVELVGLGKNTVIDGSVVNNGKITNLTITGSISGTGEYLCYDPDGRLITNRQIVSDVEEPSPPFVVASQTEVANLNANLLQGHDASYFATAGSAFENPMTTAGDMIVGGVDGAPERFAKGTDDQVLVMTDGEQAWEDIIQPESAGNLVIDQGSTWDSHPLSGDATMDEDGVLTLASTAVTPGTYSNPTITVDAKGRITAATDGGSVMGEVLLDDDGEILTDDDGDWLYEY